MDYLDRPELIEESKQNRNAAANENFEPRCYSAIKEEVNL